MKNVKKKGKNVLEIVKTFLLAIIAMYKKKSGCAAMCRAPARGII